MYMPQGYQNTTSLLTFFVVDDEGFLVDPNEIGYRIKDESGVSHTPQNGYIDVTTIGRFDKGAFYAVDECENEGWVVPTDATAGAWSIEWRWKVEAGDAWKKHALSFDVVAARDAGAGTGFVGLPYRAIVSPLAIRAHGLTTTNANDARLEELIQEAQSYLETACRQHFRPEAMTLRLQGGDGDRLYLNLPIIGVESLKRDHSSSETSRASLVINHARIDQLVPFTRKPDPRRQPTISFKRRDSIFSTTFPTGRSRFRTGRLNQVVKGVFGFLEQNGTVPIMLRRAATILVYNTAVKFRAGAVPVAAGPMTAKTVDRHSVSYANTGAASVSSALSRTKEVQEIVRIYRSPIAIASPDPITTIY